MMATEAQRRRRYWSRLEQAMQSLRDVCAEMESGSTDEAALELSTARRHLRAAAKWGGRDDRIARRFLFVLQAIKCPAPKVKPNPASPRYYVTFRDRAGGEREFLVRAYNRAKAIAKAKEYLSAEYGSFEGGKFYVKLAT